MTGLLTSEPARSAREPSRTLVRVMATWCLLGSTAVSVLGQDLTGSWEFKTETGDRVLLTLVQDSSGQAVGHLAVGGLRFTVRGRVERGVLRGTIEGEQVTDRFTARLLGTSLLWQVEGSATAEYAFQAVEPRADPGPGDAPLRGDPFAGSWIGAGVELVLEGDSGTYRGTVTIAGEPWEVLARANGTVLICTIVGRGEAGRLTGVLSGDALMLSGGAASAVLHRSPSDSTGNGRPR